MKMEDLFALEQYSGIGNHRLSAGIVYDENSNRVKIQIEIPCEDISPENAQRIATAELNKFTWVLVKELAPARDKKT